MHEFYRIAQCVTSSSANKTAMEFVDTSGIIYFMVLLDNFSNRHQSKAEDILSSPFSCIKAFRFIQTDTTSPDFITVSALNEIGFLCIDKSFSQISVLIELCKQSAHRDCLSCASPNTIDITGAEFAELLLFRRIISQQHFLCCGLVAEENTLLIHDILLHRGIMNTVKIKRRHIPIAQKTIEFIW